VEPLPCPNSAQTAGAGLCPASMFRAASVRSDSDTMLKRAKMAPVLVAADLHGPACPLRAPGCHACAGSKPPSPPRVLQSVKADAWELSGAHLTA